MNARRILMALNLALAAVLLYVVAGIAFPREDRHADLLKGRAAPIAVSKPGPRLPARTAVSEQDCAAIVERNIFGSAEQATKVCDQSTAVAMSESRAPLQLKLLGTIAGDPDVARAVILDVKTKSQSLYKTNDEVQGAVIIRIQRNRVALLNSGREEIIELSTDAVEPAPAPAAEPATAVAHAPAVKMPGSERRDIDTQALLAKAGGIDALAAAVKVAPYAVDGLPTGIQLAGIENAVAGIVGLENGDVIKSVNGQNLTSLQKAFQVLRKARRLPSAEVQLLRGSEERTISFGIR